MRTSRVLYLFFCFAAICILAGESFSQGKLLTYSQIFEYGSPRITQPLPSVSEWLDSDNYLEARSAGMRGRNIYRVNALTGDSEIYFDYSEWNQNLPEGFRLESSSDRTDDYTKFVLVSENDLYFFSTEEKEIKKLTDNTEPEENPIFSPDGKYLAYTRKNDLFVYDIEKGSEKRLTKDGSETILNGYASWVYYEEILGRSSRYRSFYWSPDSRRIAFLRFDDSGVPLFPICGSAGQHGELIMQRYPKAGDPNPAVSIGLADINTLTVKWIVEDQSRDYYAWINWIPDGSELFYQHKNREQDTINIFSYNIESGRSRKIYTETQPSWVDFFEDIHMLEESRGFILRSDKDGWYHLYHYDYDGNLINKITDGAWGVKEIRLVDERGGKIYFHASIDESTERHLYRINLDGGDLKKLTSEAGYYTATPSPGGNYFYSRYSNINTPGKLFLFDGEGNLIRELGDSKTDAYDDYDMPKGEIFRVGIPDGYDLPVKWYLPPDFDESKRYPVIFNVYGGPGSSSVLNSYPMFRSGFYYAQKGIIYMSVDHRGSGHFGKKGESEMHRNLGKWEMNDYIEVVNWLKTKPFVDSARIGITGGSYGGYVVCMALTYGSDHFTHGIAELSVTDWLLYDNFYTERFMDKPEENPEGYLFGSVLNHADKYKGNLLMVHGTMDDNVHAQNIIQLVDKLTDLNGDFELLLYPNSKHGIGMPKRRHLSRETVEFWFKHLLNREFNRETD